MEPPFLPCAENNTDDSFFGINSCKSVLDGLDIKPEMSPVDIVIVVTVFKPSVQKKSLIVEKSFLKKQYCPEKKELVTKNLNKNNSKGITKITNYSSVGSFSSKTKNCST